MKRSSGDRTSSFLRSLAFSLVPSAIVFGASGVLGAACVSELERSGVRVTVFSHTKIRSDATELDNAWLHGVPLKSVSQVVWAQGLNVGGGIREAALADVDELFDANVRFIITTLRSLLDGGFLSESCRLVILSSVWQDLARQKKMAYVVSKAAIAGLVRSLVADLGPEGIAVNAVAPGVIDTPMSRANLTGAQFDAFIEATPQGSLCTPVDVARVVRWLASSDSQGVNGVTIRVDGGWGEVRYV